MHNNVRGAEIEEAAYQIFALEVGLQQINEMHLSFLGVDKFFVLLNQLETFGELLSAVLLAHVISKLFEITSVQIDHFFIVSLSRRISCLILRIIA